MTRFFPPAERDVKADVRDYLASIGAWWFMPVNRSRAGIPDFIVCYRGRLIAIETKRPRKKGVPKASPHQQREIEAIRAAGGYALVVSDVSKLKALITTLDWVQTKVAANVVRPPSQHAGLRDVAP